MSDEIKKLELRDLLDAHYSVSINKEMRSSDKIDNTLKGLVTIRDTETQRVIFKERQNLIVLRGRTFALEKLFDDPIGSNGGSSYISDLNRKIIGFKVGKGGTPAGDPFAPYAPSPLDLTLASAVPFRLHDLNESGNDNPRTFIPSSEIANYGQPTIVDAARTHYYMKHFDNRDPEWVWNNSTNEVYKLIMMSVTKNDCRTEAANIVNELSLLMAGENGSDVNGASVFVRPEIFSRITFPSEFMSGDKGLEIEYRIYA